MEVQCSNMGANREDDPEQAQRREAQRRLLIALNAAEISRSAICRLAHDPDYWWGSSRRYTDSIVAARFGLRPDAVSRARKVAARAGELAQIEEEQAAQVGARILTRLDADYPAGLLDLALPPPVLYLRGTLGTAPAVAIVGSRRPDVYGRELASLFGREIARAGAVVVSGFARGVDAAAHRGALEAEGGTTVAVLGCGLDVDYPRGQARLADQIAESGALVTELPVGRGPRARNFPVRNRIIAALAQTVLVVRATARSGSLITARQALELGREVATVPGRIFAGLSEGPNGLLRLGALLAQHPNDLLETLRPPLCSVPAGETANESSAPLGSPQQTQQQTQQQTPEKEEAQRLLTVLQPGEVRDAEELAHGIGTSVEAALALLLDLELGGWIRREPGGRYSRRL